MGRLVSRLVARFAPLLVAALVTRVLGRAGFGSAARTTSRRRV